MRRRERKAREWGDHRRREVVLWDLLFLKKNNSGQEESEGRNDFLWNAICCYGHQSRAALNCPSTGRVGAIVRHTVCVHVCVCTCMLVCVCVVGWVGCVCVHVCVWCGTDLILLSYRVCVCVCVCVFVRTMTAHVFMVGG